jgi:hypothetical protein
MGLSELLRRVAETLEGLGGLKVDLIVVPDTPFNRSRFARARPIPVQPGFAPLFSSPEDVILKKMDSYREGGSEKEGRSALHRRMGRSARPDRDLGADLGAH